MNNTIKIAKIKSGKYSAKQLNTLCGFNDARKSISVLRADGMKILDIRLDNNCKLYWLELDEKQLSIFEIGGWNE